LASLSAVCCRKVSSTTKPSSASVIAPCSASDIGMVPNSSSARSQVDGVPGVPTESPLWTASWNGSGVPSSARKASAPIASGAVSRPSIVETSPVPAS
jgi:hypothetical protein